ncbi:glycerophosphodiester phosphodiesterase [Anthocerotibacter panamensis]|uniref:glycerophosphodiester phosphodiesterase n=1 Tax=Anthocerotibacter panamensis TaxID=2857077 RepID=UPI001C4025F6|nr:glycerophosphodiester phosphodiesterase [Anthocerotibacter panamensis]
MSTYVIAHRGASAHAPGNTLESFQKAIELGADFIEFDVRRTRDRVLIVFHDKTIQRRLVRRLTYQEVNARCGRQVATVEEVLKLTQGKIRLDVELKAQGYEAEVMQLLLTYFREEEFVITSFHDICLRRIKARHPGVKVGLLLGRDTPRSFLATHLGQLLPLKRYQRPHLDFLAPHYSLLRWGILRVAKRSKLPVFVWTVNSERLLSKYLHQEGIAGVITDYPDVAQVLR